MTGQNGDAAAGEDTPLLRTETSASERQRRWGAAVMYKIFLAALMVAMSFGITQVPLIYVFRVMTCEAYYEKHDTAPPGFHGERCSVPEIEASTAKAVALLGASTTLFGMANLFVTGWLIKRIGIKGALLIQVFWPAMRLVVQNIGVTVGGEAGVIIVQASQIITIIGGPNGYMLALNTLITEVVDPSERTPNLGKLNGYMFFGSSIGYIIGGESGERFGIIMPFRIATVMFCVCTCYVFLVLPKIPKEETAGLKEKPQGLRRFFGPLKVFAPSNWALPNGCISREYGPILLAIGVYFGILATGYIPVLLQMYATDIFGFGTRENGNLIALNQILRGAFLSLVFPKIIHLGRKHMQGRQKTEGSTKSPTEEEPLLPDGPVRPNDIDTADVMDAEQEPQDPPKPKKKSETFEFDLMYARWSLLLDGCLTLGATFIRHGWQIYLVAVALPFAAGTAAASKGTILQMCPESERVDALSAITLVENMARLCTVSIFGLIFAAFATIQKTYLIFVINAAVALLGFCILLFARFPPKGAERLNKVHEETEENGL